MPLIDIQRNHATMYSIRLGEKITKNGKTFPGKLKDKLRVTSPNKEIVDAFTAVYGGTAKPWEDGQFEAYLPTDNIRIMLLPGQSIVQWWELYKGGVCERRCEGFGGQETITGQSCLCPSDFEQRPCKPMTRLNFICPDVNTLGAGTLVTHSKIAAETLPQEVEKAEVALRAGTPVPAILRAVHRVGKARQYVVPQVEIVGVSYFGLASGETSVALQTGGAVTAVGSTGGGKTQPALASGKETPASPPGVVAPKAMRDAITRQATAANIDSFDLEGLVLAATGKYLDEVDFSVDDANKVLEEIGKRK